MTSLEQRLAQLLTWMCIAMMLVWTWFFLPFNWMVGVIAAGIVLGLMVIFIDEKFSQQLYHQLEGVPLTRSSLFMVTLVPLSIFVFTSAGSLLGTGLMLGVIVLRSDGLIRHSRDTETLQRWLPLVGQFPTVSSVVLRWAAVVIVGLMSLVAIIGVR